MSFMLLLPLYLLLARSGSCTCRPASTFPWTAPQAQTQVHALIQDPATRGDRALHWYESTSDELLWNACFWDEACSSGGKQVRQEKKPFCFETFRLMAQQLVERGRRMCQGVTTLRQRQSVIFLCRHSAGSGHYCAYFGEALSGAGRQRSVTQESECRW